MSITFDWKCSTSQSAERVDSVRCKSGRDTLRTCCTTGTDRVNTHRRRQAHEPHALARVVVPMRDCRRVAGCLELQEARLR